MLARISGLSASGTLGEAAQVDPMNPILKPPGTQHLKLKCDTPLSTSAFKFNLRGYDWVLTAGVLALTHPAARLAAARYPAARLAPAQARRGGAVQVEPINPILKSPGTKCLTP
jgi:hypothetical protein